jgi:hypothetical protein
MSCTRLPPRPLLTGCSSLQAERQPTSPLQQQLAVSISLAAVARQAGCPSILVVVCFTVRCIIICLIIRCVRTPVRVCAVDCRLDYTATVSL